MKLLVKNVSKKYNDTLALDHVSFSMESGVYALLGPNGAGKSTLINVLCTLIKPTSGCIEWEDSNIQDNPTYLKELGYMPQYTCLYDDFTMFEYLNYMGYLKGMKKSEISNRISFVCNAVSLPIEQVRNQKLSTFSGGMKQRVMLAQALLADPKILILDEPKAGLDPLKRMELQNLIAKISEDKIILFATHVVSDVEYIANEFLLLKKGKLLYKASRIELCEQIKGYVKEEILDDNSYMLLNQSHKLSMVRYENDKMIGRVICDHKENTSIEPNMNDVYLYFFHEDIHHEI